MRHLLKYPITTFFTLIYVISWLINVYLLKVKDYSDSPAKGFVSLFTIGSVFLGIILLISLIIIILSSRNKERKHSYIIFFIIVLFTFIFDLIMN